MGDLFTDQSAENERAVSGPVICLGMTFENDEARRAHFTEELRKKMQDPEFRKVEGFPIGSDEDILNLSDPPYYTACPNPWIADFIAEWAAQKPCQSEGYHYHREPFAADVSEGKNDPIYNAHSYHTKVPHKAIMRYILHYTQPGDIVFDGFCGTGMTGVAAQMCGDREAVMSLGYQVKPDGTILQEETNEDGKNVWTPFSKLGARRAVLNDLSPAATFIAYNYNTPVDVAAFEKEAKRILNEVEKECGWMYETRHSDARKGRINFTIWSDVFVCPECAKEVVFWKAAVDKELGCVKDEFDCPHCSIRLTKRNMERAWVTKYDNALGKPVKRSKQVPVVINYTVGGKRVEKEPDAFDLDVIERVSSQKQPYWFPSERMMEGKETRRNDPIGATHVNHYYTDRNLYAMSALRNRIFAMNRAVVPLGMWFTSSHVWGTRLNRLLASNYFKKKGGVIGQTLQGTLYISSIAVETNLLERFALRIKSVPFTATSRSGITETCSASANSLPDSCIDYLFIDPPFGSNINYSELNSLWES
ncbi:MAG: DNA methyltransferase, partial [Desulforhabdus sp.]|nr:DNA methyltransferase [Desulforhabdus sp.]